jgi:hypothetical protein
VYTGSAGERERERERRRGREGGRERESIPQNHGILCQEHYIKKFTHYGFMQQKIVKRL